MHSNWSRPVERCTEMGDAPSAKLNSTHRHLALHKLRVTYAEQKTAGLFSTCDTLDTRQTTSQASDENSYDVSKVSTITAVF